MEMGKIGAWVSTNALGREQLVELARGVEELGYDTLWYPESTTYESIAMGGFLLAHSEKLKVVSGIAVFNGVSDSTTGPWEAFKAPVEHGRAAG